MTPQQQAALDRLAAVLAEVDGARRDLEGLLAERARAVRALVDAGVPSARVPELTGLSEGTVKADLRRLPRA